MKKFSLLLLLSAFALTPLRVSGMMEEVEKTEAEKGGDPHERTIKYSKEKEEEALIEQRKSGGSATTTTTEILESTSISSKEFRSDQEEALRNLVDPDQLESEGIFDVNTLNEKIIAARDAQQAWKEMQQWIRKDHEQISIEDKNNLLEEAHDAVDYWNQLKEQALSVSEEIASGKEGEILKFAKISHQAAHEAQATQELLEKAISSRALPLLASQTKQLFLEPPFSPSQHQEKLAMKSSSSKEEKISYYASQILNSFPDLFSPQSLKKKEEDLSRIISGFLEEKTSQRLPQRNSLATQAKTFREQAVQLQSSAYKKAQQAQLACQQLEYDTAISFYKHALQLAEEARHHAQNAATTYKAPAWQKISKEIADVLQEKANQWSAEKCQVLQKLTEAKKKDFEEREKKNDQKGKDDRGSVCRIIINKLKVLQRHFKNAADAYAVKDDTNGRLHEGKAEKTALPLASLEEELQSLEQAKEEWDTKFQTKESRCLEKQEQKFPDGTKLIRQVHKIHFTEGLRLVETKVNNKGTILKEKEMPVEYLMVELHSGDTKEDFLTKLQENLSNDHWKMEDLSPQYGLYTLHFQAPEGSSRLELFDKVQRVIKENQLAADCYPDVAIIELASSEFPEKGESKMAKGEIKEPWSLHAAPIGINPPENLFNEINPAVPKPPSPIRVAILDTGIRSTHHAFKEKIHYLEDEEGEINEDSPYGYDATAKNQNRLGYPEDIDGHGTHVAGIIAGVPQEITQVEIKKKKINEADSGDFETIPITPAQIRGVASMKGMVEFIICKNLIPGVSKGVVERTIRCINYAREQGAQIINCSWGGAQDTEEMSEKNLQRLQRALSNNYILPSGKEAPPIAVVSAAGNLRKTQVEELIRKAQAGKLSKQAPATEHLKELSEEDDVANTEPFLEQDQLEELLEGLSEEEDPENTSLSRTQWQELLNGLSEEEDPRNKDVFHSYPAGFPLLNALAVGATKKDGALAPISYYGKKSVQITAPGTRIISASNNGDDVYRILTGTSMAAPHVTAALALMKAKFPRLSWEKLAEHLCEQADKSNPPEIKVVHGRLHLAQALMEPSSTKTSIEEGEEELEKGKALSLKKKAEAKSKEQHVKKDDVV